MTKAELTATLLANHQAFQQYLATLSAAQLESSRQNKWTPVQQLEHICLSVQPVRIAFALPTFLLRAAFGKANRASRTYDALIAKYKARLEAGGRATGRFIPARVNAKSYRRLDARLTRHVNALVAHLNGFSEDQLDQYILPHPLLGKLTLREMIYFTCYHVLHHLESTRQNLTVND